MESFALQGGSSWWPTAATAAAAAAASTAAAAGSPGRAQQRRGSAHLLWLNAAGLAGPTHYTSPLLATSGLWRRPSENTPPPPLPSSFAVMLWQCKILWWCCRTVAVLASSWVGEWCKADAPSARRPHFQLICMSFFLIKWTTASETAEISELNK